MQLALLHHAPINADLLSYLWELVHDRSVYPVELPVDGTLETGLSRDADPELTPHWDDLDFWWTAKRHIHQADGDPVETLPDHKGSRQGRQETSSAQATLKGGGLGQPSSSIAFGGDDYYEVYGDSDLSFDTGTLLSTVTPTAPQDGSRTFSLWFFGDPGSRAELRIFNDTINVVQLDIVDSSGVRHTTVVSIDPVVDETITIVGSWSEPEDTLRMSLRSDTFGTQSSEKVISNLDINSHQNGTIGATGNGASAFTGLGHDFRAYPDTFFTLSELETLVETVHGNYT
jgi:hypothetical protein